MTLSIKNISVLTIVCLLLAACSGTKHLPPGEKLYTGLETELESAGHIRKKARRYISHTAANAVRPEPNKKFLGSRPKLWMYMTAGDHPESRFKKWLKKRGEAPVLMSSVKPSVTASLINASLFNIGIFKSYTEYKSIEKKHTGKFIYISHIHEPYTVKDIVYAVADEKINRIILSETKKSWIKPGDYYSLEKLKNERLRVDAILKNHGYFYFSPDYLLFKADTSSADRSIVFTLALKDSVPEEALGEYRINDVFIDQDYSLDEADADSRKDTVSIRGTCFLGKESEMKIRPKVISRSVYFRKNDIYSRKNHNITLNRLMTMGNFKFVRIKFSEPETISSGFLDAGILMTPMPQYTFRAEMDVVSKSNDNAGPRFNVSFMNRNAFRGAELLNLNLAASFETQLSGKEDLYSYTLNPKIELYFPRFLAPFKMKRTNSLYIPKTRFSFSYDLSRRVGYFDMQTLNFIYGFRWKEDIRKEHELDPVNINFTTLENKTEKFNELLETNPFLKKNYEEEFIAGGTYSYTYNEQVLPQRRMQYFLQLLTETAGNFFSLMNIIEGEKISAAKPSKVAGSAYSQYARLSVDGRGFYNFGDKSKMAFRVLAGVARPYGNSEILPYSRQFFSGGPSSIRAFSSNSAGPGTYNQNNDSIGFLQLGGEVKLEMNAEYRFTIYRFFKGAIFTDAGNVWLLESNPSDLGGAFSFSRFADELAVGAGIGLRVDVSFFVLRFDLATPLRKPWLEDNERWVIDQINIGSRSWRKENLILNIAIGYPF
ncbi:MAG: BamA/TamA family outer membrane protein [Bacteroidales bacterium]|nr:BamA/TamA family outer membrane protein [Bacteroidales bacterium]